jgi:hypothetical protein
MEQSLKELIIN